MILSVDELIEKKVKDDVIVFETDTVYGIGCKYNSLNGVGKIYDIKSRDYKKPMAILCSNIKQVKELVINFEDGQKYIDKFWPGELTLVFKKSKKVDDLITSNLDTIGIRIPNNETCKKIIDKFGPMVVTSLNQSNEEPVLKFNNTLKYDKKVDYIVKGKDLYGISSTVFDILRKKVLREGNIKIDV